MFKLRKVFAKKKEPIERAKKLQLISIHIPKTAGTSFRNTLKKVYGQEEVIRLDINTTTSINQDTYEMPNLPLNISVIHGHFSYSQLINRFPIEKNIPVITWVRNPVERVISNYNYLSKRLKEELDEKGRGLNILSKMQKTLLEYAALEINQNRISKFLEGLALEDFSFIGIQEYYSEDLQRLSKLLDWKEVIEYQHNVTGSNNKVDQRTYEIIKKYNQLDWEIYEEVLALRNKHLQTLS